MGQLGERDLWALQVTRENQGPVAPTGEGDGLGGQENLEAQDPPAPEATLAPWDLLEIWVSRALREALGQQGNKASEEGWDQL